LSAVQAVIEILEHVFNLKNSNDGKYYITNRL